LTLGNIPRAIRRKPSKHACVLIGYLPSESVANPTGQSKCGSRHQRLFHESMRRILLPLIDAGRNGVPITGGDGKVRLVYPILSCYVADFPEQCLVTCSKYGTCAKCRIPAKCLQDPQKFLSRSQSWTLKVIEDARIEAESNPRKFFNTCMSEEVSGSVYVPFWKDFPHCDIHRAITSDVLHQLYQGVFKHIIGWCKQLLSAEELDARVRALPSAYGVRHFNNGISVLSQISGPERKQMAKILLGCLVGKVAQKGIRAIKALLDFVYLAQYKAHNTDTLGYLQAALNAFEKEKSFFIETNIRLDLNIPKFHSLHHYIECIQLFGTTDNYNTEMFERLHIDFAKEGWRASNQKNAFPQMIAYLSRQEKASQFDNYLAHIDRGEKDVNPSKLSVQLPIFIAKYPPFPRKLITAIQTSHVAPHFSTHLKEYLNSFISQPTSNARSHLYSLPFERLDVYSQFRFKPTALDDTDSQAEEVDTVKAHPISDKNPHGRFDTVVILNSDEAEETGVEGTRIGRTRVIFKLPSQLDSGIGLIDSPASWPKDPLAYIEWYKPLRSEPDKTTGMYVVGKTTGPTKQCSIIKVSAIRQSCMLIPKFDNNVDWKSSWTTENVLDEATSFYLNNWQSSYTYQTLW
jgi:hypothetical protein